LRQKKVNFKAFVEKISGSPSIWKSIQNLKKYKQIRGAENSVGRRFLVFFKATFMGAREKLLEKISVFELLLFNPSKSRNWNPNWRRHPLEVIYKGTAIKDVDQIKYLGRMVAANDSPCAHISSANKTCSILKLLG